MAGVDGHPHAGARHPGRGSRGSCGSRRGTLLLVGLASSPTRLPASGSTLKAMGAANARARELDAPPSKASSAACPPTVVTCSLQLGHALSAGAGHRLVGADHDPAQPGRDVQRLEHRHGRPSSCSWGWRRCPWGSSARAWGLTSATTSGTSGSIRQAEELSTTIAPAAATSGRQLPRRGGAGGEQGDVEAGEVGGGRVLDRRSRRRPTAAAARPSGRWRTAQLGRPGSPARRAACA